MNLLRKILNFRLYGKQKLLLSFEYGVMLSEIAKEHDIEITREFMEKSEAMIESEFKTKTPTELSVDAGSNMLSVFEIDLSK